MNVLPCRPPSLACFLALGTLALAPMLPGRAVTVASVAPDGLDSNPGTEAKPFLSLERARNEVRSLRARGALPVGAGTIEVAVKAGEYRVSQSFRLTAEDSGTAEAPVVYQAHGPGTPRFSGAARLTGFRRVTDPALLARLPEASREQVREVDLTAAGVTHLIPLELGGFSSGRGFRTHPAMELYVDSEPMTLARWPNEGFVMTGDVPGPLTLPAWDRKPGSPEGRFRYEGDRPARWVGEPDAWLYGYWFWSWADSYEKIARIDTAAREIHLEKPWHTYGYRKDQRYFALNLLSELDRPGEWYLDRASRRLLLYPDRDLTSALVELSGVASPLLDVEGASHLRLRGLLWEGGAGDGVLIRGGTDIQIEGCTIRKMSGTGIEIQGGHRHGVNSCDLHTLGRGGIALGGGDRRTLEPSGHRVENCHIHHLSRIDHTYTPGLWLDGVGHQVRNCLIHDVASSALRVEGNDHLIELNEAHRVVLESDDQGAVDMFGNPTYRGNVYRHNYWHHLGNWRSEGDASHTQRAGIRLDDAICGTLVQGNIFQRCTTGKTHFGGVQIHGGKENLVEGNLFLDCGAAVSFTPWGDKRWREFVAPALDAPAVDRRLYLDRYPALRRLAEDHDTNQVRNNLTVRCGALALRAPGSVRSEANRELPESTAFREGPDGRLVWSAAEAREHGVEAIPFARIGVLENAWRSRDGTNWVLRTSARERWSEK
ncbi:MAG: right-handed parallel beta-helix repeat-containing protein [Verrucomicrobiales bacterium]|nr:right-handed parallel beta-helix repeat-containing protein [Verrucomicrobiales bacterium]